MCSLCIVQLTVHEELIWLGITCGQSSPLPVLSNHVVVGQPDVHSLDEVLKT